MLLKKRALLSVSYREGPSVAIPARMWGKSKKLYFPGLSRVCSNHETIAAVARWASAPSKP